VIKSHRLHREQGGVTLRSFTSAFSGVLVLPSGGPKSSATLIPCAFYIISIMRIFEITQAVVFCGPPLKLIGLHKPQLGGWLSPRRHLVDCPLAGQEASMGVVLIARYKSTCSRTRATQLLVGNG
jgi:hypothetical protein